MLTDNAELGELLAREGLISQSQLEDALAEQTRTRQRLGEILRDRGLIHETDLLQALARQMGLRRFDPARDLVEAAALDLVSVETARRHLLLPIRVTDNLLTVAMSDPTDVVALDQLRTLSKREVEVLLAPGQTLEPSIERHYGRVEGSRGVKEALDEVALQMEGVQSEDILDEDEAKRRAEDAPIVKLVEQIIVQALNERATDIHIEPQEGGLVVRYRVDGLLYVALTPPAGVLTGLTSRIKILANLDIAERRKAQDGRFTVRLGGREVDIRVSSIPTIHDEKLVLRLLDKQSFNYALRDLGFSENDYDTFRAAIHQPYGMVLLSGPTGSGKTTTLYAGLLELRSETLNITTVEDPVEYQISRVNQVQVNPKKQVTFANALRSFLRQDPDVIMVGEVRDQDTAEMAVRAALTGHMVFSTIHANDAPATATRLVSMGVEPFQAASALSLVAAQRLVRRNCSHCLVEYEPPEELLLAMGNLAAAGEAGTTEVRFRKGEGCAECRGRGYLGRVAIIEMMRLDSHLRRLVAEKQPADALRSAAREAGMKTLKESGFDKVRQGVTTLEEVLRVCLSDE